MSFERQISEIKLAECLKLQLSIGTCLCAAVELKFIVIPFVDILIDSATQ